MDSDEDNLINTSKPALTQTNKKSKFETEWKPVHRNKEYVNRGKLIQTPSVSPERPQEA